MTNPGDAATKAAGKDLKKATKALKAAHEALVDVPLDGDPTAKATFEDEVARAQEKLDEFKAQVRR